LLNTNFTNASGWHDKNQYSTALDLARLGLALQTHHTKYAPLLKKTQFTFRGKVINGHNRVLAHYPGAEGGKTGFHSPGGFNLVSKVKRNGKDLVAVVTGGTSAKSRDTKMVALLDRHCGVNKTYNNTSYKICSQSIKYLRKENTAEPNKDILG
jgi:D-alanyl-D-alanine carboxypeptidase (penicillin-binding protein 5/6)